MEVVHTYTGVGTYVATVTVTDDMGDTGTASVTITADLAPVAVISAAPLAGRAPLEVSFSAAGSTDDGTIEKYAWDFGDGETAEGVEVSHTYAAGGEYTVVLTVTDNFGNTGTASVEIAVEPAGTRFKRGDTNADGTVDLADAICTLGYLFGPASDPCKAKVANCLDAADANDDGAIDLADAIKVLSHLFGDGGPLPEPFAACGLDPTDDAIGCEVFPACR
jgi:chitodextrinase